MRDETIVSSFLSSPAYAVVDAPARIRSGVFAVTYLGRSSTRRYFIRRLSATLQDGAASQGQVDVSPLVTDFTEPATGTLLPINSSLCRS